MNNLTTKKMIQTFSLYGELGPLPVMVDLIGIENVLKLAEVFQGEQIQIPDKAVFNGRIKLLKAFSYYETKEMSWEEVLDYYYGFGIADSHSRRSLRDKFREIRKKVNKNELNMEELNDLEVLIGDEEIDNNREIKSVQLQFDAFK